MDSEAIVQRLTRLEVLAEQAHKEREVMGKQLTELTDQLSSLNRKLEQARGARMLLLMLISIGPVVGGLFAFFGIKIGVVYPAQ